MTAATRQSPSTTRPTLHAPTGEWERSPWSCRLGRAAAMLAMLLRDRPDRRTDDRGSVAVLMCYIVLLGALLTGFVVDAGTNIDAANKADTYSSEAARAATIAIGPIPATDGTATLQAAAAARTYLAQAGASGEVQVVGPATVQVTVTVTETTPILGVSVSQTRTHTAQLLVGVTGGEAVP